MDRTQARAPEVQRTPYACVLFALGLRTQDAAALSRVSRYTARDWSAGLRRAPPHAYWDLRRGFLATQALSDEMAMAIQAAAMGGLEATFTEPSDRELMRLGVPSMDAWHSALGRAILIADSPAVRVVPCQA